MEKAITKMGTEQLSNTEHIHHDWKMVKEYPLSKELLAMSRVFTCNDCDWQVVALKVHPKVFLTSATYRSKSNIVWQRSGNNGKWASVLGVAKGRIETLNVPEIQHDFEFTLSVL